MSICRDGYPVPFTAGENLAAHAAAYLARSAALLESMVVLAKAGDREAIPVLYRTLLETWYSGVYLALGGEDAMARLDRQLTFEGKRIARAIGEEEPTGEAERLPVAELAKLVEALLEPLVEDDSFPTRSYNIHYRIGSYHWSHGHLGSLMQFFTEERGHPEVTIIRGEFEGPGSIALHFAMSVSLVASLCNMISVQGHSPTDRSRLGGFLNRWRNLPTE